MPQPLKDIGERIELLQMTLGIFAPEEPAPIAAELLQLGEETLEHALLAGGVTPVAAGAARLERLLAQCRDIDPAFAQVEGACQALQAEHDRIGSAPDSPECGAWLVAAAAAAGDLYSFVAARGRAERGTS